MRVKLRSVLLSVERQRVRNAATNKSAPHLRIINDKILQQYFPNKSGYINILTPTACAFIYLTLLRFIGEKQIDRMNGGKGSGRKNTMYTKKVFTTNCSFVFFVGTGRSVTAFLSIWLFNQASRGPAK